MITPTYYQLPASADLYELWRQRYGYDAAALHLIMCLGEYQYRATEKGAYASDIAKIATITARLAQWAHEEGRPPSQAGTIVARMSLDDMETALSFAGWWLASPDEAVSETCERMAQYLERQGWFTAQTDEDAAAILREAGYTAYKVRDASATLPGIPQTEEEVADAEALIDECPIPLPPELATPPDISHLIRSDAPSSIRGRIKPPSEEQPDMSPLAANATQHVEFEHQLPHDREGCIRPGADQPCYVACGALPSPTRCVGAPQATPEGHATLRPARAGCVRFTTEQACAIACLPHALCQLAPALQTGAETVYEHCAHQLAVARGMRELHAGVEVLLREDLAQHGIPAESEYELVKHELARKDKRFPVIQE